MKVSPASPAPPKRRADPISTQTPPPARPPKRRARRRVWLFLFLAILLAMGKVLTDAWRLTERREATLPQLETMAQQSPDDGPLLALLGGRRAESHEASAADALRRAAAAGEDTELVWQSLAAVVAASGDPRRAGADLQLGRRTLEPAPALDAAWTRVQKLGLNPEPDALAAAIAPSGPAPLVYAYTRGSFLNGLARWWGHHFPERSGFATRQEWARQAPNDAQVQRLWGLALLANQRLAEAGPTLARAVALAPRSPAAHLAMADALEQGGFQEKAGLEYIACLKLQHNSLPALLGLGHNALEDHLSHAVPAYQRATQIAPQSVEAWIGLGRAELEDVSTNDKALAAFQTAARLAPERTDFFADYSEALRQASRSDEAEALLRRRLAAVPGDAQCHFLLGQIYMNDPSSPAVETAAENETREALRLSPRQPKAEVQLAQILLRRGAAREAVPLLQDALAAKPYDVATLNVLTRAARQAGNTKLAEALTVRSTSVYNDQQRLRVLETNEHQNLMSLPVHTELTRLYRRTGQAGRADQEQEMVRLLQTNPKKVMQDQQFLRSSIHQVLPDAGQ